MTETLSSKSERPVERNLAPLFAIRHVPTGLYLERRRLDANGHALLTRDACSAWMSFEHQARACANGLGPMSEFSSIELPGFDLATLLAASSRTIDEATATRALGIRNRETLQRRLAAFGLPASGRQMADKASADRLAPDSQLPPHHPEETTP